MLTSLSYSSPPSTLNENKIDFLSLRFFTCFEWTKSLQVKNDKDVIVAVEDLFDLNYARLHWRFEQQRKQNLSNHDANKKGKIKKQ